MQAPSRLITLQASYGPCQYPYAGIFLVMLFASGLRGVRCWGCDRKLVSRKVIMKLFVGVEFSPIRAGIEARSPELRICGHGESRVTAVESLRQGVQAWSLGLKLAGEGELERALRARGLTWEADGETIDIEIEEL